MDSKFLESKVRLQDFNSNENLDRGASKVKEALWYITKILFFLNPFPFPVKLKIILLRIFGAKVGKGFNIKPRVNIHFPWKLEIGDDVWIGEEVFILNFELVKIGNNVCISQRAFLCGGNHNYKLPSMPFRNGPINLHDGCWIGACCFIGPNINVGIDSVIAAGSVVTIDIDDNGIYRGNPAVFQKPRWS